MVHNNAKSGLKTALSRLFTEISRVLKSQLRVLTLRVFDTTRFNTARFYIHPMIKYMLAVAGQALSLKTNHFKCFT